MLIIVQVEWAEWQCVKDFELGGNEPDHPHEDGFYATIDVPDHALDDDAKLDAAIHDALIEQCGLCIIDGSWGVVAWNPTREEVDNLA